jgi:hypothetical protein
MQSEQPRSLPEVLVIFRERTTPETFATTVNQFQVQSLVPPRIAVLVDGGNVERLTGLPEVEAVMTGPADAIPGSLTDSERLFVSAWQTRQQVAAKNRPGEGLAWDAPGFLPPDPPKRR